MSRLIIQMGTTVSSQVLNMIIYILIVQQSLGLEQKKKVDRIGESFILFSIWTHSRCRVPWVVQRGRFGQVIIIQFPPLFLQEVTFIGSLKGLLARVTWKWRDLFFYFIFSWLFSTSFTTPCPSSFLWERTRRQICKWLTYVTNLFFYLLT